MDENCRIFPNENKNTFLFHPQVFWKYFWYKKVGQKHQAGIWREIDACNSPGLAVSVNWTLDQMPWWATFYRYTKVCPQGWYAEMKIFICEWKLQKHVWHSLTTKNYPRNFSGKRRKRPHKMTLLSKINSIDNICFGLLFFWVPFSSLLFFNTEGIFKEAWFLPLSYFSRLLQFQ